MNTVLGPGQADAAVLKLAAPGIEWTGKGLALSADATPGWCRFAPRVGTAATVAECALNVSCVGARPLGLVNCLNFGNPEHPEVMWQLSESIDGMAEACRALQVPVVGGNVSFYNESGGADIDPTPVVGMVGLIDRLQRRPPGVRFVEGAAVVVLGQSQPDLGGSRWAVERRGHRGGVLPLLDYAAHAAMVRLVAALVSEGELVEGIHDVSGGGLGVALAECAVRSGVGCRVEDVAGHAGLFSESPSRVVVVASRPDELLRRAGAAGVPGRVIGSCGGPRLVVAGLVDVSVADATSSAASRVRATAGYSAGSLAWSAATEAVGLLSELGEGAKVLAGGQSLVPMLALRLAAFDHLVDVGRIDAGSAWAIEPPSVPRLRTWKWPTSGVARASSGTASAISSPASERSLDCGGGGGGRRGHRRQGPGPPGAAVAAPATTVVGAGHPASSPRAEKGAAGDRRRERHGRGRLHRRPGGGAGGVARARLPGGRGTGHRGVPRPSPRPAPAPRGRRRGGQDRGRQGSLRLDRRGAPPARRRRRSCWGR